MTSSDLQQTRIELEDRVESLLDVREWIDARITLLQSRLAELRQPVSDHYQTRTETRSMDPITRATKIRTICDAAHQGHRASSFIDAGFSPEQVSEKLLAESMPHSDVRARLTAQLRSDYAEWERANQIAAAGLTEEQYIQTGLVDAGQDVLLMPS